MPKFTASLFDKHKSTNDDYMIDYSLLDNNVISALNGNTVQNVGNDNTDDHSPIVVEIIVETEEEAIDVENGLVSKIVRVKKVRIHKSAIVDILTKGREKMISKNLPAVRYRKKCRMQREQIALRD